ncbi:hypothetical protein FB451DRAFT_1561757 [Mycena latifolia]|nr:hypothetical protein FB451DRAFT_1561757 [Mycena latifolia]
MAALQSCSAAICAILDSNDLVPDEIEAYSIRDLLSAARMHRARLDAETTAAPRRKDLFAERDAWDLQIAKYEGALSPLRRMPTEILSIVFDLALLVERYPAHGQALWAISQTCARWHTIMLSQPALWAVVNLHLWGCLDNNPYRLETQLRRSGQLPLQIAVSCSDVSDPAPEEPRILSMLVEHCLRWETFALSFQLENDEWDLGLIQGRLPLLRELDISMDPPEPGEDASYDDPYPVPEFYTLDYFRDAPNLRHVSINEGCSYKLSAKLPLPQLLRYHGNNLWAQHLDTLRSASNLVDCALEVYGRPSFPAPIPLPHLRRLAVKNSLFLRCIDAPALEELYCAGATDEIVRFLQVTPSCRLQKLFIHKCGRDPSDFAAVLRAVPTLVEIGAQFIDRDYARDLCSVLTLPPASDIGELARLKSIAICFRHLRSGSAETDTAALASVFTNMIEFRWRAGGLHAVAVSLSPVFTSSWADSLREEGLKITLDKNTAYMHTLLNDMTPPHLRIQYLS